MKKLILVFVAFAITAGAYAQADSTNRKMHQHDNNYNQTEDLQNNPVNKAHPDGVMRQNEKVMMVKNGQMTILDHDMVMSNGTKIMSDGTFIKKDGTKMMMKEGEHMDMSGNVNPIKTDKDRNMYLVPDSTIRRDK